MYPSYTICFSALYCFPLLFLFLIKKDICGALEYLKDLQNMFLEEVINIAANGCRSLLYIQGGLRSCPIYELKASGMFTTPSPFIPSPSISPPLPNTLYLDVVSYEWSDEILQYSQLNLEYGKGKEVVYNFAKIELELAHNLVSGKAVIGIFLLFFIYHFEFCLLSTYICFGCSALINLFYFYLLLDMENMVEFEFHRELFHGFSTILQDIQQYDMIWYAMKH